MLKSLSTSICWYLIAAAAVRFILIIYGIWQDNVMAVGYTDIDYTVFTDAARYMTEGLSPYRRATYRYTPIMAFLLQGNIYLCASFGKLLFVFCDILSGYLIHRTVQKTGASVNTAISCAQLWLFNPLTMVVSTRGNAESVMAVLVIGMLYLLKDGRPTHVMLSAVLYGLSVHTKIYPAIYVLALYMYLNYNRAKRKDLKSHNSNWFYYMLPTSHSILFGLVALLTFAIFTAACYAWYGDEFLINTYLYHVTRRDIRHNFSVYFYFLYLTSTTVDVSRLLALAAFIPQLTLTLFISVKFYRDLEMACFLLTFIFVTFNKVCTSQYFLWYLCLVPLVVTHLRSLQLKECGLLFALWIVGQGVWLFPAYLLEFHGYNVYIFIWLAGHVFFIINIYIVYRMIVLYRPNSCSKSIHSD